jgi:hypothetical protein
LANRKGSTAAANAIIENCGISRKPKRSGAAAGKAKVNPLMALARNGLPEGRVGSVAIIRVSRATGNLTRIIAEWTLVGRPNAVGDAEAVTHR